MSTFSQVSAQWYTSAGEEAEGRVQQSCLPSRHLCPPGKHIVCTTHLATGSVYVPIYLSIHRSSIYHKSFLTICLVYLSTYLSSYLPIHLSTTLLRASSRRQLSYTKKQGRRKRCYSFISHPPPLPTLTPSHPPLTPSHFSPHTLTLPPHTLTLSLTPSHFSPHTLTLPPSLLTGHGDVHRPSSV